MTSIHANVNPNQHLYSDAGSIKILLTTCLLKTLATFNKYVLQIKKSHLKQTIMIGPVLLWLFLKMLNYDNIMHCHPSETCSFATLNYDNIMHCHPRSCCVHKLAFFTYCFSTGKVLTHWECLLRSTKINRPFNWCFQRNSKYYN